MKKNVLMRAASGLLVATMLTTCAISGTFAKYVTQDNGGDVARVAKWGVVVQVEGDLYGQKYLNKEGGNTVTLNADDNNAVGVNGKQIADELNVVAPGTNSSDHKFAFGINGTPEVDSQTTIKVRAQNIYLNEGEYGVMVPLATGVVTEENFKDLADITENNAHVAVEAKQYNGLWVKDDDTKEYTRAQSYQDGETYYTLEDYVDNGDIYYPVVYAMNNGAVGSTNVQVNDTDDRNDGPDNKKVDTIKEVVKNIFNAVKAGEGDDIDWLSDQAETTGGDATVYTATVTSDVIENNQDLATVFKLANQSISWNWEFEDVVSQFNDMEENATVTDTTNPYGIDEQDKLDTILGNLMAERVDATNSTNDFKGEVVKLNAGGTGVDDWTWKAPTEATTHVPGAAGNDFELDTMFDIDILVEQVD